MPHGYRPVVTPAWLPLPGQNSGGETKLDSPHQEAHSREPPHHHPPEGEFLGCPHPSS